MNAYELMMEPCLCGSERKQKRQSENGFFYQCCDCGFRGFEGLTIQQAEIGWGNAIFTLKEMKEWRNNND